jgi:hypothetical protein
MVWLPGVPRAQDVGALDHHRAAEAVASGSTQTGPERVLVLLGDQVERLGESAPSAARSKRLARAAVVGRDRIEPLGPMGNEIVERTDVLEPDAQGPAATGDAPPPLFSLCSGSWAKPR